MDPVKSTIQCWWPDNTLTPSQLMAMVTRHQAPDKDWRSHPCEIMKSYGAYLDAHLGAKNRTKDKNYETEKELGIGLRKKTQSKRLVPLGEEANEKKLPTIVSSERKASAPAPPPVLKLPSPPKISTASGSSKSFKVGVNKHVTIVSESKLSSLKQKSNQKTVNILRRNKGSKATDLDNLRKIIDGKKQEAAQKKGQCSKSPAETVLQTVSKVVPHPSSVVENVSDSLTYVDSHDEIPSSQQFSDDGDMALFASSDHRSEGTASNTSEPDFGLAIGTIACSNMSLPSKSDNNLMSDLGTGSSTNLPKQSVSKSFPDLQTQPLNEESLPTTSHKPSVSKSTTALTPDFECRVLRLLHTLDNKIENVALNQARLNLRLLPDEKVLKKPPGTPNFPIISWEDCKIMENYLKNNENIADMSLYFSAYVSKDPQFEKQSTKEVLENFIGNCVGKKYSFKGRRGKLSFSDSPFWTVIKGALASKLEHTTLSEAIEVIKSWLKDAEYRVQEDGSECKRKETRQVDEGGESNSKRLRRNVRRLDSDESD